MVASKSGVVYAIDSAGGGGVVWKRDLLEGLPGEGKERDWWSGGVSVGEMGLVRGVGEIGNPIVAVVVVDSTDEVSSFGSISFATLQKRLHNYGCIADSRPFPMNIVESSNNRFSPGRLYGPIRHPYQRNRHRCGRVSIGRAIHRSWKAFEGFLVTR